jgi:tetratricopeptide (TPR) repeat protein
VQGVSNTVDRVERDHAVSKPAGRSQIQQVLVAAQVEEALVQATEASGVSAQLSAEDCTLLTQRTDRLGVLCWLGQIARKYKHTELAHAVYRQATQRYPHSAELLNNWANLYLDQQNYEQAILHFQQALAFKPSLVSASYGMGLAYRHSGQLDRAFECFKQAIRLDPGYLNAYLELAQVLNHHQQWQDAQVCLDEALRLNPSHGPIYEALGLLAMQQKQPHQALEWYEKAARHQPLHASLYSNLANCLMSLDAYAMALPYLAKALAMNPSMAIAHYNHGVALGKLGQTQAAIESYNAAIAHKTGGYVDAEFNRSLMILKQGDYTRGWEAYESRLQNDAYYKNRRFTAPFWQGEPLGQKTILVAAEQGFGDLVQFTRFLPPLKAQGAKVIVESPPELLALYASAPYIDQLIEKGVASSEASPDYDYVVYLMSLPALLKVILDKLPAPVAPALLGDQHTDLTAKWSTRLALSPQQRNIGICWASKYSNPTSVVRSCQLADFGSLTQIANTRWFGLQKGLPCVEAQVDPVFSTLGPDRWWDLATEIQSFADTMAIIEQLDLVITVDTVVAHLAASMGKPTWVLVPFQSDWRWLEPPRTDSPWYPSARLFRATGPHQWPAVFAEVEKALQAM